jgi:hypothetical protein
MKLIGGPQDGLELTQDVAGIWCEVPIIVKNGAEHCYTYRSFPSGNIFYEPTANRNNLWFQGASFQTARYSLLDGKWQETRCSCGEVLAYAAVKVEEEDPPGPPRARPPAR